MNPRRLPHKILKLFWATSLGLLLLSLALLLFGRVQVIPVRAAPLGAIIPVNTDILSDTNWTTGDTFVVSGQIEVLNNSTLTIQPGVIVSFTTNSQLVIRTGSRLDAIGSAAQPIQFTGSPGTCTWQGIWLRQSSNNTIQHASFEYAARAIHIDDGDFQTITNNTFQNNGGCAVVLDPLSGAISGLTDSSVITGNTFIGNNTAIYLSRSGGNIISENAISGTTVSAIFFDESAVTTSNNNQITNNSIRNAGEFAISIDKGVNNLVSNNQIFENGGGIAVLDQTATAGNDVVIRNNDVYSNTGPGLFITDTATISVSQNLIYDNDQGVRWGLANFTPSGNQVSSNVICRDTDYLFRNEAGATVTAAPNWWGLNNPSTGAVGSGADIEGAVDLTPAILLSATAPVASLPADGVSTTTLTLNLNGGGATVPARARDVTVSAVNGSVSPSMLTLDSNGQGNLVYTASTTPGPVMLTVTDFCAANVITLTLEATTVDLVVTKQDEVGPGQPRTQVQAGELVTYTLTVSNAGAFTATNVVLTETLPTGAIFLGPTGPNGWFQVGSSNVYTYAVGTLAASGGNQTVDFEIQIDPNLSCATSQLSNTVTAGSDGPEVNLANNTATEQTPVTCPLLQLSKTTPVVCAIPGQLVDYTITITNNDTVPTSGLLLTENLPANTSFQGPAGVWTVAGPSVYTRTVASVAGSGGTEQTPFWVQVDPGLAPSVTAITNVVTLDPQGLNMTLVTPIEHNAPDLYVVKNDNIELLGTTEAAQLNRLEQKVGQTPWLQAVKAAGVTAQATSAAPGDIISYTIGYGNAGTVAASNVVITETLPANTSFVGPLYWTHLGGGTYVYTITSVAAGSGGNLDFRVRIDDPFPANTIGVTNTIQIGSDALLECDLSDNLNQEFTRVEEAGPAGPFYQYLPIILKSEPVVIPTPTPTTPPGPTATPRPTATPTPLGHVSDVAVDPTTNQVFIASPREDAVHVIDGSGDTYDDSVPVGHGPTGLAVLTSTVPSKVFVAHAFALNNWTPGIWIIDSDTQAVRAMSHEAGYVGAAPVKAGANSNSGWQRVYISNYFDRLPAIYGPTETRVGWVQKKNFQASYGVGVSQRTNLVYLASIDTGEVVIFDGSEAEAMPNYGACHHAPPEPRNLRMIKVNQATGHVFVTSPPDSNTGQTSSKVFVLDEDVLLQETGGPPSDLTCNWNFLRGELSAQAIPGPAWVSSITLPGAVFAGQEGLAVNPVTNKVYVTDSPSDKLFVIDYNPTTNSATSITSVTVGDNPQGVDVNPLTNKVYVGNARRIGDPYGTVTVVDGATNTVIKTIPLAP